MINKTLAGAMVAAGLVLGWASAALATGPAMTTGGRTTQPIGHYDFCRDYPAECKQRSAPRKPVELTRKLWAGIIQVNDAVNTEVAPLTDMEIWGVEEKWSYPTTVGDCEDYALEKRRRLMALGVSPGDLLMTVVRQPNGDGHAVLTVRTSLGDFILDNLDPRVRNWSETEYTYLKRQSETHSGVWVSIKDNRAPAVASAN
jgi:predicted transglutaminase-like cysteine proteinase